MGGQTMQRFIAAGCLDELILTQLPLLLGCGTPLLDTLPQPMSLQLVRTAQSPSGLV